MRIEVHFIQRRFPARRWRPACIELGVMKQTAIAIIITAALTTVTAVGQTVRSGARINVRTIDRIDSRNAGDQTFHASVDEDVIGTDGQVVIPKGSNADLRVRRVDKHELSVDLDSVT